MYEAHFGLKSRPFGSKAEGAGVFSGPRQVESMTNLKKGLTALDAVVTVTGPVGVGKTTAVSRALDTISPNRMAAWVGRMQLAPDEVLQLLLAGFGIKAPAKGTIQRFAVFRRLLAERAASGAPVAIVVEDAHRIGVDALVELEALTAADTGDATSANIILMGQPDLKQLLAQPELARLNQRTRLRQAIEPLSQPEVNGYLKHCIRVANGDYDKVFDPGVAEIVYACSGGIPRIINTLCESALTTAMEDDLGSVSAVLMHKVAVDAFGYEGPMPEETADAPSEDSVDVPIIEIKADTPADATADSGDTAAGDPADIDWEQPAAPLPDAPAAGVDDSEELPPAARNIVVESGRYPELPEIPEDSPLAATEATEDRVETAEDAATAADNADPVPPEIPELINDTQPELTTLKVPQSDEAVGAEDGDVDGGPLEGVPGVDIESTAIQETLPDSAMPPAEHDPVTAQSDSGTGEEEPAQIDDGGGHDDKPEKDNFDLDAALSLETDATNVMEGLTPDLDEVAADAKAEEAFAEAQPDPDDLPTLTDSMQVDVGKEAERSRQQVPEATSSLSELPSGNELAANSPIGDQEAANHDPAAASSSALEAVARSVSVESVEPAPENTAVPEAEPEAEAEQELSIEAALAPELPKDAMTESQSGSETPPEAETKRVAAKQPDPAATGPVAQVSEMTARIAALDPDNRSSDVDALEAALDDAKSGVLEKMMAPPPLPQVTREETVPEEAPPALPEITLDEKIASKPVPARKVPKDHLEKIGRANSLEEFSDDLAETLFGSEDLDQIAAAVVANPPTDVDNAPVVPEMQNPLEPATDMAELSLAAEEPVADDAAKKEAKANSVAPKPSTTGGDLRESQQIRADLLQSLKTDDKPAAKKSAARKAGVKAAPAVATPPRPDQEKPESIENQINTSMTQTLEALKVSKVADDVSVEKDEKEEKKGGLFARFRKSS